MPLPRKRVHPEGGFVVALMGADGSGKSTMVSMLVDSFGKKIDVYKIYFGSGSSGASRPVRIFRRFKKWLIGNKKHISGVKPGSKTEKSQLVKQVRTGFLSGMLKGIEALLIAQDKVRNIKRMKAAKKKGMLVICDRFPQNQVKGRNDGPLLSEFYHAGNMLFRFMAILEAGAYRKAEKHQPDMIIKLIADAKILLERKPGGTDPLMLQEKIDGIQKLQFAESCKVITIDVSQPLEDVALNIKKNIWEAFT